MSVPLGRVSAMIEPSALRAVDRMLEDRYSQRLREFGLDPRTLGWDSRASQETRFAVAAQTVELSGRQVLDIGCGLADFLAFLRAQDISIKDYRGIDINNDLLDACSRRFPDCRFERRNILLDPPDQAEADVVTMFGVLNFRFREFGNEIFAREMIARAFSMCRGALVVDMLSAEREASYPAEDFVYYYDPGALLAFALTLTPDVILRHDYPPIPQREFMLVLRKQPCGS